jgi:kinesin family protein 5
VNLKDISDRLLEEKVNQHKKHWEHERDLILIDLKNRVDKVVKLEMDLDEAREAYRTLEGSLSRDDQALKQRTNKLERNNEQLTLMYHQVVSEKSVLKVDLQVLERKLQRKDEKIANLEKQVVQGREQ